MMIMIRKNKPQRHNIREFHKDLLRVSVAPWFHFLKFKQLISQSIKIKQFFSLATFFLTGKCLLIFLSRKAQNFIET